jgi:hypothetical protein
VDAVQNFGWNTIKVNRLPLPQLLCSDCRVVCLSYHQFRFLNHRVSLDELSIARAKLLAESSLEVLDGKMRVQIGLGLVKEELEIMKGTLVNGG